MSQYFNLIKNQTIDFNKLLLEKYYQLDLNETEVVILLKLNSLLIKGTKKLLASELAKSMKISSSVIGKRLVDLVNKGYINITVNDANCGEEFSLDETYKRLSYLLENSDNIVEEEVISNDFSMIVKFIENQFGSILKPLDLEVINHWINIDKYSIDSIKEAVSEASRLKKNNVKYVDVFLSNKKENKEPAKGDLLELFNNVYNKK